MLHVKNKNVPSLLLNVMNVLLDMNLLLKVNVKKNQSLNYVKKLKEMLEKKPVKLAWIILPLLLIKNHVFVNQLIGKISKLSLIMLTLLKLLLINMNVQPVLKLVLLDRNVKLTEVIVKLIQMPLLVMMLP